MICLLTGSFGSGITVSPEPSGPATAKLPAEPPFSPRQPRCRRRGPSSLRRPPGRPACPAGRRFPAPAPLSGALYGAGMPSRPRLLIAFLVVLDLVLIGSVWSFRARELTWLWYRLIS